MSRAFVVKPDDARVHQHAAYRSRTPSKRTNMVDEEDLQELTKHDSSSQVHQGKSSPTMRPATPPPVSLPDQVSPSDSAVTANASPGSSINGRSSVSTALSSPVTSSPATRFSRSSPDTACQFTRDENSSAASQPASPAQVARDASNDPSTEDRGASPSSPPSKPADGSRPESPLDMSFLKYASSRRADWEPPIGRRDPLPRIWAELPSLNLHEPTNLGPYQSPFTLAELHQRLWNRSRPPVALNSCLQCIVKDLPCPSAPGTKGNRQPGPLLLDASNAFDPDPAADYSSLNDVPTAPRSRSAQPRFPACVRCVRAGEAATCIALRRPTRDERDALKRLAAARRDATRLGTSLAVVPTDRDAARPAAWAAKLRRRDELVALVTERERLAALAPRRTVLLGRRHGRGDGGDDDRDRLRDDEERDRWLLSGPGPLRDKALRPTEEWGERWVGLREWEEMEFLRITTEKSAQICRLAEEEGWVWQAQQALLEEEEDDDDY